MPKTAPKSTEQTREVEDKLELSDPHQTASAPLQATSAATSAAASAPIIGGAIGAAAADHMRLVMVGPPGAGKGTQSRFLLEERKGAHLSTGAMLRQEVENDTEIGRKAKPYMDRGELVPDDIIIDMVRGRIEKEDSFILDGFPRSVPQAEALDEMLEDMKKPLTSVTLLEVSEETILKRLLKRGRADDNEETIRNRIQVYRQQTEPMIKYFRPQGLVETVNVEGSIENNRELVAERVAARMKGETPGLSVPVPPSIIAGVKPTEGPSVQGLIQSMDAHVAEGKAPYAPSWTDAQKQDLTARSKEYFSQALRSRPGLTLPELTEACRLHTEKETLGIISAEQNVQYMGRAAALSAVATGIGLLTGNTTLSAVGGVALAGSVLFSAYNLLAGAEHKENVKAMSGTRDLVEGWTESL